MRKHTFRPMVDVDAIMQDKRLTERLIRVLLALYKYADANGDCYPSRAQLAECCGYDEGTIRRATAELQELGWLTKAGGGGRGRHVRYTIHPQKKGAESTPFSEGKKGGRNLPPQRGAESTPLSASPIVVKHTNASLLHEKQTDQRAREARFTLQQEQPVTEQNFTLTSEAPRKARKGSTPVDCPDDVTEETWEDWCALRRRKKATITDGVIKKAREEAKKADMSLEEFLKEWVYRGSQGLYADWIKKPAPQQNGAQNSGGYKSVWQRREEEAQKWIKPKPKTPQGAIIDVTPANREQFTLLEKAQ